MGKHIDNETQTPFVADVKTGIPVKDAAETGTSALEMARLRRENQELKEIIGLFALEKKRAEKNH